MENASYINVDFSIFGEPKHLGKSYLWQGRSGPMKSTQILHADLIHTPTPLRMSISENGA